MGARRNEPEPEPGATESQPLLSSRALLIILTAVLIGVAIALKPALGVPFGVGVAVVTLLVKIIGD